MGLVAKAFQDIITFSRASSGTYVNSNGYITNSSVLNYLTYSNQPENAAWTKSNLFVQQNLLQYSEQFENAYWTALNVSTPTANSTIAPDGTLTAETVTSSNSASATTGIYRSLSYAAGHTLSIYAKANTSSIAWVSSNSGESYGVFNLATGAVISSGNATASIVSVGNGWYRLIVANTTVASTYFITGGKDSYVSGHPWSNGTWTSGNSIYLWGAQLVQGSVPGDYRATTSAALPCLYADYNGELRARKLCEDSASSQHYVTQSSGASAAGTYTFAVKVKAGERNWISMQGVGYSNKAWFNLATGVLGTVQSGASASITSAGNGYYICTITVPRTTSVCYVFVANSDLSTSYTGDGSSGIYIADAQLNDGSSALAYYDTTQYAYNAPRFDYDPVTLAAKGLLIEEQRTNLLTYSEQFDNAAWNKTTATVTANATTAPNGTTTADSIRADATTYPSAFATVTTVASTSYTFSIYAKSNTTSQLSMEFRGAGGTPDAVFNLSSGTVTSGTGAIVSVGNGWYRCSITKTSVDASEIAIIGLGSAPAVNDSIYIWGAQLEAGAFATSYIPTVASQVTRAADVASVNTLSPWFNQAAGTFYAEFDAFYAATGTGAILGDGAAATSIAYLSSSYFLVSYNGVSGPTTGNATSANTIAKASLAYATNSRRAVLNAGTASNQTGDLQALTKLELGKAFGTVYLNGHLRRVTFYPRQFTAAEQQTLTTL